MGVVAQYLHDADTPIRDQIRKFLESNPESSVAKVADALSPEPRRIEHDIRVSIYNLWKGNWLVRSSAMNAAGLAVWVYSINEDSPRFGYAKRKSAQCEACGADLPEVRPARTRFCESCDPIYKLGYHSGYNKGYYRGRQREAEEQAGLEEKFAALEEQAALRLDTIKALREELAQARRQLKFLEENPIESAPARSGERFAKKSRRCMSCGEMFESEWSGNRICGDCKNSAKFQGNHIEEVAGL